MIKKIDAILSLVPDAQVVIRGDLIEWNNPVIAPITDEQIEIEITRLETAEAQAQQTAEAHRQSAIAKLSALGLTADEITALGVK